MYQIKLSNKREKFCKEYVIDVNATQAAIRAGYSEKTARQQGQRLLTFVDIKKRIEELNTVANKTAKIKADDVLKELKHLAFEMEVDGKVFNYHNKLKALELLGKHLQMFESKEDILKDKVITIVRKVIN